MADSKVSALSEVSVPDFSDDVYLVDNTGPTSYKCGTDRFFGLGSFVPGGRLTLTSGTAVTTSDVTAAGTLYYTPYLHDRIRIYDGTRWLLYAFTERSLSLTLTSGKNYDVFIYDNAGTLTLELSAAWTNDTTRADALTTQDGVYVKSGATSRLWLGTIRASGSNITEDSAAKRLVWNAYNKVNRPVAVFEATASWTYTTANYRQVNASSANAINVVCGLATSFIDIMSFSIATTSSIGHVNVATAIGEDSTTTPAALCFSMQGMIAGSVSAFNGLFQSQLKKIVPLGYHAYNWLEFSEALSTTTWYGEGTLDSDVVRRTGIGGSYES